MSDENVVYRLCGRNRGADIRCIVLIQPVYTSVEVDVSR